MQYLGFMKYLSSLLFLFSSYIVFSQNDFKLITTLDVKADFVTTDNQSNVYVVTGNELSKYNKSGTLLYKYSNKTLGNIDFVDASNLLKPLLFYKNFLQILYLDNTLSTNGQPVALANIEFQQTQLVCTSFNNGLWLYDQQNLELVRVDQSLQKTNGTGNLSALLNITLKPDFLIEYDNKVYLNNPSTGILVFDIYGTYYKTIPVQNVTQFQPIGEWVYYMTTDNRIEAYHLKTTETQEFKVPDINFLSFRLENELLILQTDTSIILYQKN